jgi:hydroxymethylbilane synthase
MTGTTILIGTRGSRLARWQASWVVERLCNLDPSLRLELVEIKTKGDRDRNSALDAIGVTGVFTKEVQRAVQDGSVDLAVHSLKDLPTQEPAGLTLAAVPSREDVADALIAPKYGKLAALPAGAHLGTSSARRRAQLLSLRPDLHVVAVRGNVETRLNHALQGHLDGVVLAWAGLRRLDLEQHVTQRMGPPEFMPAVGQGALGIECRCDASSVLALLKPLDDPPTRRAVQAERTLLASLGGGCTLPLGAWARDVDEDETTSDGQTLVLDAAVFDPDGRARVSVSLRGARSDPDDLGCRTAQALRDQGAEQFMLKLSRPSP